jgi:putative Holliday junction resolvase
MNIIAFDYGEKRIGVAVGNTELKTSTPLSAIKRTPKESLMPVIRRIIDEYEAGLIILGLPLNMDGTESLMSRRVGNFRKLIVKETGLEVVLMDERLTSFEAEQRMGGHIRDLKKYKERIDSVSAQIILSEYLETT